MCAQLCLEGALPLCVTARAHLAPTDLWATEVCLYEVGKK